MRISPRSIEEVKERVDIVEAASEFTALRRQGTNLVGLCPYPDHQEKTPSFSVSPEKGFYHCFGCKKGGDAIKLVMDLKSFSFAEAVSHLAERFGVELSFEGRSREEEKAARQRAARRRTAHKALAAATAYYHKYLLESPAAEGARYYLKERGLGHSTIVEFRLGYAPPRGRSGFLQVARKLGLELEVLEFAGLLSSRGGERFVDRVTFPISDRRGRIVGFGARSPGDAKPKYLNTPETDLFNKRSLLYGFPQVAEAMQKERTALVVEGYTDVLMLYQAGIKNAVATLGTAMTGQHLKSLSGYADKIYLLFDPDEAGEKAVERAALAAAEMRLDLQVLRLPADPADWLLEHTPEEFRELLSGVTPVLEYVFRRKAESVRGTGAAERSRMASEIKDLVDNIEDPVFKGDALRLAAETLGVDPETLHKQTSRSDRMTRASGLSARDRERATSGNPLYEAGQDLLALIFARPDLAAHVLSEGMTGPSLPDKPVKLGAEDFDSKVQAQIFSLLTEHAGEGTEAVLSDELSRPLLDEISALRAAGERLYPSTDILRAAWFRLAALSRERAKLETEDFDEKLRLHAEMKQLSRAAAEAGNLLKS